MPTKQWCNKLRKLQRQRSVIKKLVSQQKTWLQVACSSRYYCMKNDLQHPAIPKVYMNEHSTNTNWNILHYIRKQNDACTVALFPLKGRDKDKGTNPICITILIEVDSPNGRWDLFCHTPALCAIPMCLKYSDWGLECSSNNIWNSSIKYGYFRQ